MHGLLRAATLTSLGHRLVAPPRRLYWRIFAPTRVGVRVIATIDDDSLNVILVRHAGGDRWYLPGGGVRRRELLADAAVRELREETGVEVASKDCRLASVHTSFFEGKSDHIVLYSTIAPRTWAHQTSSGEIADVAAFPIDDLPRQTSPGARRRLDELRHGASPDAVW